MCTRRQLLGGGSKLFGGRCDLFDEITDVLRHGVEVRGEPSELVVRVHREIGEVQPSVGKRIHMTCEFLRCRCDRRGKAQQGDDDADDEQDADNGQSRIGDAQIRELSKCHALGNSNGDDPSRFGDGCIGDDLILIIHGGDEVSLFFLLHFREMILEDGIIRRFAQGIAVGIRDNDTCAVDDDAFPFAVVFQFLYACGERVQCDVGADGTCEGPVLCSVGSGSRDDQLFVQRILVH